MTTNGLNQSNSISPNYQNEHLSKEGIVSSIDSLAKKILFYKLKKLEKGHLVFEDGHERYVFGESSCTAEISAVIRIRHSSAYREMVFGGALGGAESYMRGEWASPALVDVTRLLAINLNFLNKLNGTRSILKFAADKIYHLVTKNSYRRARQNISAHYDLSNDFFSLFLDPTMMYSSAIFENEDMSLNEASKYKLDRICRKLELNEGDHLLEIGTGWGGLAIHAAQNYGCKVTTTTISEQQYVYACEKIKLLGLEGKIKVLLEDYRNLKGTYDKLVSIEMIEAVGYQYYESYFSRCQSLLKPSGKMLLQSITIPHNRYDHARKSMDFIKRYIFPGGCLPSREVIASYVKQCTSFSLVDLHEIGEDYAETLRCWREKFFERIEEVKSLGFDDDFVRMWEYYFCYCEGGFRQGAIGTAQFLYVKEDSDR